MDEKERPDLKMECGNFKTLVEKYGPNYSTIKQKLGHIKGLVTDDI